MVTVNLRKRAVSNLKSKLKKPPAHEVILDRIEDAQRALLALVTLSSARKGARGYAPAGRADGAIIREHRAIALALFEVLNHMYLSKSARSEVLQRLRAFDDEVIGGLHRPYVHVLKELPGHNPSHVIGEGAR